MCYAPKEENVLYKGQKSATWRVYINDKDYVHSCEGHVKDYEVKGFETVEIFPVIRKK